MGKDHHEARRLTANWLNILAASVVSVGGVAPLVTLLLPPLRVSSEIEAARIGTVSLTFIVLGIALHLTARSLLREEP